MNIYLLERKGGHGYDEAGGFVVAAPTAAEARILAGEDSGDEGAGAWEGTTRSTCRKIGAGASLEAGVVLRSYNAG